MTLSRPQVLALLALALGITILVASEFIPAGVLPLIAHDLNISVGTAALAVASTSFAGMLTAPLITTVIRQADRRNVLLVLLVLSTLANVVVALAPAFWLLLVGRFVLGIAIAGYWSLAFGAGVHVLPSRAALVSTTLATGTSLAAIIAVPLAAAGADSLGWRNVFWLATAVSLLAVVALALTLPAVPAHPTAGLAMMVSSLRNGRLMLGVLLVALAAFGNFTAYPFIRVAIERVDPGAVAWLLLIWGVGGLIGNTLGGALSRWLRWLTAAGPLLLALSLMVFTQQISLSWLVVATLAWGIGFNLLPVTTQLWVTTAAGDSAESAISLQVTAFQTAITIGSIVGGVLVDHAGLNAAFSLGACTALLAALGYAIVAPTTVRQRPGVVPISAEKARTNAGTEQ